MYRIYIYYLKGQRKKDFEDEKEAIRYANRFLNRGNIVHITVEDIENCKVIFDEYSLFNK